MSTMTFLKSNAGKGTIGVFLACTIIVWPLVASWLIAALILAFAVHHLRESFRQVDEAFKATPTTSVAVAVPAQRGEVPACDVDAVMAELAAKAARPTSLDAHHSRKGSR
jgi:hypothetical protein